MSTIRLLIAAVVLAGLSGAIWWSNKQEEAKKSQPDPKAAPKILSFKEEELRKIELERKGEPTIVLTRDDAGKWSITAPEALATDSQPVTAITAAVTNLSSDRVVDEKLSDPGAYGLESPAIALNLTMKDGSTKHLRVGEQNADKSGIYAMVDGDPRLYLMPTYYKDTFDKRVVDLREKHLMTFTQTDVSRVELNVVGKPGLEFSRTGDSQWQILKPRPMRADSLVVNELLRQLKDAAMDVSIDAKQAASEYAAAKPLAVAKVTTPAGVETLEVRNSDKNYYAHSSSIAGNYKISESVGAGFDKPLVDFQNLKLFDFGFDDPSKIEYKSNGETKTFEKNDTKWLMNGRTMDSVAIQNLIDKLRDLSANRGDDAKVGSPNTEITVVSKSGSRTEKILLSPDDTNFLIRRDGEPMAYHVDSFKITAIKQAVDDVKEESAAAEASKSKDKK